MAEGRSRQLWGLGSQILAAIHNGLMRGQGDPAFTPEQFNPHREPVQAPAPATKEEVKEGFAVLRAVFVKEKPSGGR